MQFERSATKNQGYTLKPLTLKKVIKNAQTRTVESDLMFDSDDKTLCLFI